MQQLVETCFVWVSVFCCFLVFVFQWKKNPEAIHEQCPAIQWHSNHCYWDYNVFQKRPYIKGHLIKINKNHIFLDLLNNSYINVWRALRCVSQKHCLQLWSQVLSTVSGNAPQIGTSTYISNPYKTLTVCATDCFFVFFIKSHKVQGCTTHIGQHCYLVHMQRVLIKCLKDIVTKMAG